MLFFMAEDLLKQRLNDINAISIAIDTYEDIFSDFDPRDLPQRNLSEDFIIELMTRHRLDPKGKYNVVIVAPEHIKEPATEKNIVSRLNKYFNMKYVQYSKTIKEIRVKGLVYVVGGMAVLIALTLLAYARKLDKLTLELVGIIFMPLGWFGIWEGFSKIIDIPFKLSLDTQVYKKLSKAAYTFEYISEPKKAGA